MDTDTFWYIIGLYNQQTWMVQLFFTMLIVVCPLLLRYPNQQRIPLIFLGISNTYMGSVFFLYFGTEPVQHYFAAPLFISVGFLFLREGIRNGEVDFTFRKPMQWILLILTVLYPGVSHLSGHSYPEMTTPIMPCPLISISITIYSGYERRNRLLLLLMAIWGLTGFKSFVFDAGEDIILLLCGIYAIRLLIGEIGKNRKNRTSGIRARRSSS